MKRTPPPEACGKVVKLLHESFGTCILVLSLNARLAARFAVHAFHREATVYRSHALPVVGIVSQTAAARVPSRASPSGSVVDMPKPGVFAPNSLQNELRWVTSVGRVVSPSVV